MSVSFRGPMLGWANFPAVGGNSPLTLIVRAIVSVQRSHRALSRIGSHCSFGTRGLFLASFPPSLRRGWIPLNFSCPNRLLFRSPDGRATVLPSLLWALARSTAVLFVAVVRWRPPLFEADRPLSGFQSCPSPGPGLRLQTGGRFFLLNLFSSLPDAASP